MSHTPQQPADGWQHPQPQPPVYRPNEQPPQEEQQAWSPESQRMAQQGRQVPMEEQGTVKYAGGPGQPQPPQFGPPPGVPVSPFDAPPQQAFPGAPQQPFQSASPQQPFQASPPPQQPFQGSPPPPPAADPFGPSGGYPVSGMPVSGMPPVSSVPASGMPVSGMPVSSPTGQPPFGGGQFGPQGGQLVPVSGGGAQPWGAPDTIQRKKKSGGKGPKWIIVAGVVVIVLALGVGGFVLFNPTGGSNDDTGTIESSGAVSEAPGGSGTTEVAADPSGLSILALEGSSAATNPPGGFTSPTGLILGGDGPTVFFGPLDPAAVGAAEAPVGDVDAALQGLAATWAGGEAAGAETMTYQIDGREAVFSTFTVGDLTVMTAVVANGTGHVGFVGSATADQVETLEAARDSLSFGS